MNTGQMSGAAVAGLLVAAAGAGWALLLCGIGMVTTVPLLLSIRGSRPDAGVTMARNIPSDKLARVSSYDVLGSVMAMPAGALIAGPLGTAIGISQAQYAAAAVIIVASALALIPRDIRTIRSGDALVPPLLEAPPAKLEAVPR